MFSESEYGSGFNKHSRDTMAVLKRKGIHFRYIGGLMLSALEATVLATEAAELCRKADGYWLFCSNTLFNSPAQLAAAKPPWNLKAGTIADYWKALAAVSRLGRKPTPRRPRMETVNLLAKLNDTASDPFLRRPDGLTFPDQPSPNLLTSWDFETDDELKGSWSAYYSWPKRDGAHAHHGQSSVLQESLADSAYERPTQIGQKVAVSPGRTYQFEGWVRTERVIGGYGAWMFVGESGVGGRLYNTHSWTRRSLRFANASGEKEAYISLRMHYAKGKAWFDDLRLSEVLTRQLTTKPVSLRASQSVGLTWCADCPDGSAVGVDVLDAESGQVLLRTAATDEDLSDLRALHGCQAVLIRARFDTWRGQSPVLRRLTMQLWRHPSVTKRSGASGRPPAWTGLTPS